MREGKFTGFEVELRPPGIAEIRFNRPERMNGMTHGMKRDLIETLVQAQMDDAVRVVLFLGSGRAFCAGDDLKGYLTAEAEPDALVPPLPAGHGTPIGTYDGLRTVSQKLNATIRGLDKLSIARRQFGHIELRLQLGNLRGRRVTRCLVLIDPRGRNHALIEQAPATIEGGFGQTEIGLGFAQRGADHLDFGVPAASF